MRLLALRLQPRLCLLRQPLPSLRLLSSRPPFYVARALLAPKLPIIKRPNLYISIYSPGRISSVLPPYRQYISGPMLVGTSTTVATVGAALCAGLYDEKEVTIVAWIIIFALVSFALHGSLESVAKEKAEENMQNAERCLTESLDDHLNSSTFYSSPTPLAKVFVHYSNHVDNLDEALKLLREDENVEKINKMKIKFREILNNIRARPEFNKQWEMHTQTLSAEAQRRNAEANELNATANSINAAANTVASFNSPRSHPTSKS